MIAKKSLAALLLCLLTRPEFITRCCLKVSGNASAMTLNVDAAYIAQKLLVNQAKTQLFKVFDKAFGTQEEGPVSP